MEFPLYSNLNLNDAHPDSLGINFLCLISPKGQKIFEMKEVDLF